MGKLYYDAIDWILEEKKTSKEEYTKEANKGEEKEQEKLEKNLLDMEQVKNEKKKVDYKEDGKFDKAEEHTTEFLGDEQTPEKEGDSSEKPDDKHPDEGNISKVKKINKQAMTDLYINFGSEGD
jgi:hypothetical protein